MAKSKSKKAKTSSKTVATEAKSTKTVTKVEEPVLSETLSTQTESVETESATKEKSETVESAQTKTCQSDAKKCNPFKGFFACKHDANENILTIFKNPKIYGALIGEAVGVMLITILFMTLGVYQPLYIFFGIMAITVAVFALSGAHLNPIVTAGMMASRRVSAIRGVLYMLAQVLGAWVGLLIVNAFRLGSGGEMEMPALAEVESEMFWAVTMIEFMGAAVVAFFFARGLVYKKSPLTFAAIVAGGLTLALLFAIVISSNYFSLQNNFMLNPAIALMHQILPTSGDGFFALVGEIALALTTYVIMPMIGGVLGFAIADVAQKLSEEDTCCCHNCDCK